MKRSTIFVLVFSVGVIVGFSFIVIGIKPDYQLVNLNFNGTNVTLDYEIDFDYCNLNCDKPSYVDIKIFGKKIHFKQVYSIYCNADDSTFWLDGIGNSSTIRILQIFEPESLVAKCVCPILITGTIGNFDNVSFILEFVSVNNYVQQNHTIDIFSINM